MTNIKTDAPSTTPAVQQQAAEAKFPKGGILLDDHGMRADSGFLRIEHMVGSGYKSTSGVGRQVNKAISGSVVGALRNLGADPQSPKLFDAENYNANPVLKTIHERLNAICDKEGFVPGFSKETLVIEFGDPRRILGALIEGDNRTVVVGPDFQKYEEV